MSKFEGITEGMELIVIADTFEQDPHGVEVGTRVKVIEVSPAIPKNQTPEIVKLILMLEGQEPFDLPARVLVEFGDEELANLAEGDFEIVEAVKVGDTIQLLEDDYADGFGVGNIFKVVAEYDENGEFEILGFFDLDNDFRPLDDKEFKVLK